MAGHGRGGGPLSRIGVKCFLEVGAVCDSRWDDSPIAPESGLGTYRKKAWGAAALERSARETGAFLQARVIKTAVDLLRLIFAYCLGSRQMERGALA
jgi:hypothetical protein